MFFKSSYLKRIVTKKLTPPDGIASVTHRQELLRGFDQRALECAAVILIGGGGIGSEVGEGLVRKGVGCLKIFDHDAIELSNLNRQMFFKKDVHKKKGGQLAVNLAAHATSGTVLEGYNLSFQDAVALGLDMSASAVVCGVDNGKTRVEVCNYFRKLRIPGVFIAVDYAAEHGYVFVQEPGKACFGCVFPKTLYGRKAPCQTPAVKDILKVVAGLALYAIDSLLMHRKRNWNFRNIHLAGFAPSDGVIIEKNPRCPLCHE
jgi:molybdopterin/thiamine biosynthesis adenylyltransferase